MIRKRSILALALCLCTVFSVLAVGTYSAKAASSVSFTNIFDAAKLIADTAESKKALPAAVKVGKVTLNHAQFLFYAATATFYIDKGISSGRFAYKTVSPAVKPEGSITSFNMYTSEYLIRAQKLVNQIKENKYVAPNYINCSNGHLKYQDTVYMYAKILRYYKAHKALPNYCFISSRTWGADVNILPAAPSNPTPTPTPTPTPDPTPTGTKVTALQVAAAAKTLADSAEKNYALPASVSCGSTTLTPAQFLYLACKAVVALDGGNTSASFDIPSYTAAPNPQGECEVYNMMRDEYVLRANKIITFMDGETAAPNYASCSGGQLPYQDLVYDFGKLLRYYHNNGALPNYVATEPLPSKPSATASWLEDTSAYSSYLVKTTNCDCTNATLKSVGKTGVAYGGTPKNMYEAAKHLMNYLNDKTSYCSPMYYDTKYGALGTWKNRNGNCCDLAHLANACARSQGIPGRYVHGRCKFSSGNIYGHVWAEFWCGKSYGWKTVDLVSASNYLGYKTSTNLEIYNRYITLPF